MEISEVILENLREMREDTRDALREIKASISIMSDPVTGYVPRTEIDMREARTVAGIRWAAGIVLTVIVAATAVLGAFHH